MRKDAAVLRRVRRTANLRKRAGKTLERLERFPKSGRVTLEFPDLSYREVIVSPYRFSYREEGRTIWIVANCRGAKLPEPQE